MKSMRLIAIAGLAGCCMTACTWFNPGDTPSFPSPSVNDASGTTITVPQYDNPNLQSPSPGPTISDPNVYGLKVGKSITVDCGGINPSVGFDWHVADGYDQSVVSVQRVYHATGIGVGGGGNLKYVIKGLAAGQTTLTFTYDWRLQKGMIGVYIIQLQVAS